MSRKIIVQRKDEEPIQVSLTSNSGFILLEQETVSTIHTPVEWDDITAAVATLRAEQTGAADALDPPATHPPIWEEIRAICDDIDLRDLQERIAALEAWRDAVVAENATTGVGVSNPGPRWMSAIELLVKRVTALEARPHYVIGVDIAKIGTGDLSALVIQQVTADGAQVVAAMPMMTEQTIISDWAAVVAKHILPDAPSTEPTGAADLVPMPDGWRAEQRDDVWKVLVPGALGHFIIGIEGWIEWHGPGVIPAKVVRYIAFVMSAEKMPWTRSEWIATFNAFDLANRAATGGTR